MVNDSFWLTEHHFQREGYEITPNVVLVASVFAEGVRPALEHARWPVAV